MNAVDAIRGKESGNYKEYVSERNRIAEERRQEYLKEHGSREEFYNNETISQWVKDNMFDIDHVWANESLRERAITHRMKIEQKDEWADKFRPKDESAYEINNTLRKFWGNSYIMKALRE